MPKPGDILKVGQWSYDRRVKCRVEIQFSDIRYGSGDYEDAPEWRDDQPGGWFVLSYASPTEPTKCPPDWKAAPGYSTLSEAIQVAEETLHDCDLKWQT
mgnify:CR=1 FL=1